MTYDDIDPGDEFAGESIPEILRAFVHASQQFDARKASRYVARVIAGIVLTLIMFAGIIITAKSESVLGTGMIIFGVGCILILAITEGDSP